MTLDELRKQAVATAEEVAPVLRESPRSVYRQMDRGEIPSLRLGRRRLIPVPALMALLGVEQQDAARGGAASESSSGSNGEGGVPHG